MATADQTEPDDNPIIRMRRVSKIFTLGETQISALRDVNLDIPRLDFTAVIGASGAGKTTLMNIVGCVDSPTTGSVLINGIETAFLSEPEKARLRNETIGFVFQTFNLIPTLNVFENIELPLLVKNKFSSSERAEIVNGAIDDVGLSKFRKFRPDKLSGGQRQRVAIARALVTSPKLIIADEPTANLDSKTARQIVDLLVEMNESRDTTFLFSTHDEKLMDRVKRVVRIQDGCIIA